jgi:hypothetical protein
MSPTSPLLWMGVLDPGSWISFWALTRSLCFDCTFPSDWIGLNWIGLDWIGLDSAWYYSAERDTLLRLEVHMQTVLPLNSCDAQEVGGTGGGDRRAVARSPSPTLTD